MQRRPSSMPRLEQASWQVYRKPAASSPSMLLSLDLNDSSGSSKVNVEMSRAQVEATLASLSKVKELLERGASA